MRSTLQAISEAIIAERQGLEARYRRECGDAGFLMEAMDNNDLAEIQAHRLDGLSVSILHCERRMAHLSAQLALMQRLQNLLETEIAPAWPQETGPA